MLKSILIFIARFGGGGILSYSFPKILIALGVPLDNWLKSFPNLLSHEAAYWLLVAFIGIFVISLTYIIPFLVSRNKKGQTDVPSSHKIEKADKESREQSISTKSFDVFNPNATFIVFNPNAYPPSILKSHNINGSITDNGVLDFTFTFDEPLENENCIVKAFGKGRVIIESLDITRNSIRIKFEDPCSDLVRLEFELQGNINRDYVKESQVKQRVKRKTEIINQLNQFVRNGNALLLKISNWPISQFTPNPKGNEKHFPMEQEIAKWNLAVYNYLKANVLSRAEYYHRLSTRNIPSINHSKNPQEKTRAAIIALMQEDIERIIEIIEYVDSSDN
jgi:hypothetical protein